MAKKINLGKVGITTEGNYDSSKAYEKLCCVLHNGVSWVSTTDVPAGNAPDEGSAYWQKISDRGEQGPQGPVGPQGNSAFDGNGVEIVNNLTQGGESAVLSAEQGKVLKTEVTELSDETRKSGVMQPSFTRGSISSTGQIETYYNNRVYSSLFRGPFVLRLADNYGLFRVVEYDANGNYKATLPYINNAQEYTLPTEGYYRFCLLSLDSSAIDVNGDIITFFSAGATQEAKQNVDNLKTSLFEYYSKNLLNPQNVDFSIRYSAGSRTLVAADANLIAASGLIEVEEGEWYTISGNGIYSIASPQGGYFADGAKAVNGQSAIDNISFVKPVTGEGMTFQVPYGKNIKYALISLATNSEHTALSGDAQLEKGEMATPYEDYNLVYRLRPELLPSASEVGESGELAKFTSFNVMRYEGISDKFPNFRRHWILKDKDLVVVNTGTSLTARSGEHCTLKEDAPYRPPLMHSNNFASHIWDALAWEGQQYRRYDAKVEQGGSLPMFTEVGSFQTQSNIADWDDGSYRQGFTRYSESANSSISYQVPSNAKRCNFIYRTDMKGSESCVISIAEGNGQMQVQTADGSWVEANGYTFSMRESAVQTLPSVTYVNPSNRQNTTLSNVQVKGNTTYQKRLNMRAVSVGSTKNVTISSASGRLLYWGVEYSERPYMITYINAARGSYNSMIGTGGYYLINHQDNEVWSFKPDLILSEDPIHNSGASGKLSTSMSSFSFGIITENFFMADNGVSMKSRCESLGLEVPEMVIFNTTLAVNFGGFDDNGNLYAVTLADGVSMTALDAQMSCYQHMKDTYSEIVYLNAVKNWVNAAKACYDNLYNATIGSGKDGATFTNEGSHWNDTGSRVMARYILPVLDFIN